MRFKHVEKTVDYLMSPRDSDAVYISGEQPETPELVPGEDECLSEVEDIGDNFLCQDMPGDVCVIV